MQMRRYIMVASILVVATSAMVTGFWLLPQDGPTPTEIVYAAACGHGVPDAVDAVLSMTDINFPDTPYDPEKPQVRHTVSLDGGNLASHGKIYLSEDYPSTYTTIIKDRYRYERADDDPWQVNYIGSSQRFQECPDGVQGTGATSNTESATDTVLRALGIPAAGEYEYRGTVTLNGTQTKHYSRVSNASVGTAASSASTDTANTAPTPTPIPWGTYLDTVYDEVWINADGHFVRVEGREPFAGIYKHIRFRVDYSGYGNPNTITAPFALPNISTREIFTDRATNAQLPAALNAPGPVTYSLSPTLPDGLVFNAKTRTITGTPAVGTGSAEYTLTAVSSGQTVAQTFLMEVLAAPEPITLYVGQPYDLPIRAEHLATFSVTPPLPPGLTSNVAGRTITVLLGTPTTATPAKEYTMLWESPAETFSTVLSLTVAQPPTPTPTPTATPTPTPTPTATPAPTPTPTPANPCVAPLRFTPGFGGSNAVVQEAWGSDCASTHRAGSYARFYTFTLSEETAIRIDLVGSGGEDAYLFLLDGAGTDGAVNAENNDRLPNDPHSLIQKTLPAGAYTVEATTNQRARTGNFFLIVNK